MKKILMAIVLLMIPKIVIGYSAECYVAMDYDSGRVLLSKNPNKEKLIASTTKIMSAIVAIENSDLNGIRVVGKEVLKAYGSAIYLNVGEKITLRDLLYGLMLRSGNDAAIEIAYHVSGGMDEFVKLMNDKAFELGMNSTVFINNHGLEEEKNGNISTAYDMALLMRYAIDNDIFKKIINTKKYTSHTDMKTYSWVNKNKLLGTYKYMVGGKTGYTKLAGRSLVTVSEKDKKKVIVVTINDGDDFADHKNMAEYIFNNYERYCLLNKNNFVINKEVGKYYINKNIYALLTGEEMKHIKSKVQFYDNDGGMLSFYLNNNFLIKSNFYSYKNLNDDNFIKKIIKRVFGW